MTGAPSPGDGLDVHRRRTRFRAWHRGMREMDLILGRFADASIAAPIVDHYGRPEAAVNIATSTSRFSHAEVISRFSSLVIATAHAISRV